MWAIWIGSLVGFSFMSFPSPSTWLIRKKGREGKEERNEEMGVKAAAATTTPLLPTAVRLQMEEGTNRPIKNNPSSSSSVPHLYIKKPSWVVRTESNVRREVRKKPNPPCVVCKGTGRVDCHHCSGKGRTNCVDLIMLPKGEWPKWCRTCGGSGLGYCSRCLGTGEYRDIMGFHFMKMDASREWQDHKNGGNQGTLSAAERLLFQEPLNPNS